MTVHEMKQDMVHLINQMDDSSEQHVKDMWIYVRTTAKPKEKDKEYSPEIQRKLELVRKYAGAFSACQTVDWKKDKEEYLEEKYGR